MDTCDDSLRGLRDRALLLFAWASGGRRRSEVVRATIENTPRGEDGFLYLLRHSKTNQAGAAEDAKPIVGAAARAQAWLDASGIAQGPLFRRIRRGDVLGEPLAAAAVRDIVRQRCELAGLDELFRAQPALGLHHRGRSPASAIGRCHGHDGPRQRGHGHGYYAPARRPR